ncbi:MAG: hypothetical protein EXR71_02335 [Myxococcales bacterium]|nr:hypothetical protein [Myxococcales bacterium]
MAGLPALTRTRTLVALTVSVVLGFSLGAGANVAAGTQITLSPDVVVPTFEDAPALVRGAAGEVAAPDARPDEADSTPQTFVDRRLYSDAIVRRNIFDSAAVAITASADPAAQDCKESKAQLLATVVADVPDYSSALISDGGKGRANGYRVGDSVGSEGRILTISQKKVCLEDGGCLCIGTDDKRRDTGGVATGSEPASDDGGVTRVSDTKFLVDRSFLEKQLGNVETLATQVRAAPKSEDGKIIGFRLSGIRKGSVFDKLGIKNGDVVHNVNGQSLTSMETALGAYGTLQNERAFNFEVTRRNQKMTIDYEVR